MHPSRPTGILLQMCHYASDRMRADFNLEGKGGDKARGKEKTGKGVREEEKREGRERENWGSREGRERERDQGVLGGRG